MQSISEREKIVGILMVVVVMLGFGWLIFNTHKQNTPPKNALTPETAQPVGRGIPLTGSLNGAAVNLQQGSNTQSIGSANGYQGVTNSGSNVSSPSNTLNLSSPNSNSGGIKL